MHANSAYSASSIEELRVVLDWLPSRMFGHVDRSKNEQFETSHALRWVGSNFLLPLPNAHRARNRLKRKLLSLIPRDQPPLTFGYSSATLSHEKESLHSVRCPNFSVTPA